MDPLRALPVATLRRRTSMKWRHYPPDVLPVWVAEMDVPLAEPVTRALVEAVTSGDTGYAQPDAYIRAMVEFAAARWDWHLAPEQVALVPDVMRGVAETIRLMTGPGDPVIINSPVYPPFYRVIEQAGRTVVEAPLNADGRLDPAGLETAFAATTTRYGRVAYLLCSPHNPTGVVHTREELTTVTGLAARYGVRVMVDEVHAPIVYPGARHLPYLTLPGTERAVVLFSASKAWHLAGLKAAVAVAGPDAVPELDRWPDEVWHGASHLGVLAHTVALTEGGPWLDGLLAGLDENRRLLADLIAEHLPGVGHRMPEGTYLAWLDCRSLDLPDDPAEVFLARGRVAVNSGVPFGTGGAGHVRFNFATRPDLVVEAVHRMAAALR